MSLILDTAKNAIIVWGQVRENPKSVINYLNQGACFIISYENFKTWDKLQPEYIHAYLGLVLEPSQPDFSLSLFCVDSITDSTIVYKNEQAYDTYLKEIAFSKTLPNDIFFHNLSNSAVDTEIGLKLSMQWQLYKDQWIEQQTDLVQVFIIPFKDLANLFAKENVENTVLVFALKPHLNSPGCDIDMIMWGQNAANGIVWENNARDFLRPCPPYCNGVFMLMEYAFS